jgi:hypothetical protein
MSLCFSIDSDDDKDSSLCFSIVSSDDEDSIGVDENDEVSVDVEPPPLRRSARIAAKKSADKSNSCQVILERPIPPLARIAVSGIRAGQLLSVKRFTIL